MDLALLDQLSTLVIIIDADTYQVKVINHSARAFLSSLAHLAEPQLETQLNQLNHVDPLSFSELFPDVKLERLLKRISKGKSGEFVVNFTIDQLDSPIIFKLKLLQNGDLMLEGSDHSAVRETEHMLKSYSELIEKKNRQYKREQRRVERLLFNTLPEKCVSQLRQYGRTRPERFDEVSVLFLDFVGFTELSQRMSTDTLFSELNEIFTAFDTIISQHRCERIKTIGDAYLAVCGMPDKIKRHAELISSAAFKMRAFINARNQRSKYEWRCRIGIHTGEVTGGVVGRLKYIYDIFGDGVNTASRMESNSKAMHINMSKQTSLLLSDAYQLKARGLVDVKGKGPMEMFYLEDIIGEPCAELLVKAEIQINPQDSIDEEFMIDFSPFHEQIRKLDDED